MSPIRFTGTVWLVYATLGVCLICSIWNTIATKPGDESRYQSLTELSNRLFDLNETIATAEIYLTETARLESMIEKLDYLELQYGSIVNPENQDSPIFEYDNKRTPPLLVEEISNLVIKAISLHKETVRSMEAELDEIDVVCEALSQEIFCNVVKSLGGKIQARTKYSVSYWSDISHKELEVVRNEILASILEESSKKSRILFARLDHAQSRLSMYYQAMSDKLKEHGEEISRCSEEAMRRAALQVVPELLASTKNSTE